MPRFNSEKWKPTDDSSPGYRTVDPDRVVLVRRYKDGRAGCPCGCGDWPLGEKAIFAMGHDARLRGKLIRAHLTDTQVMYVVNLPRYPPHSEQCVYTAMEIAEKYGWKEYLDNAVLRRDGRNRQIVKESMELSDRLVRVVRWDATGQAAAIYQSPSKGFFDVKYVTQAGEIKQARVPAREIPVTEGAV